MLYKTQGIVLKATKYGETSLVAQILTKKFGRRSFLIKGIRKTKSKLSPSLFQPLNLLKLEVEEKKPNNLGYLHEVQNMPAYMQIPFNHEKMAVMLFLQDLLCKCLPHENPDQNIFDFLHHFLQFLDLSSHSLANLHLIFMLQFSKHLGFYPQIQNPILDSYFDFEGGFFTQKKPLHTCFLAPPCSQHIFSLDNCSFETAHLLDLNHADRQSLLKGLVEYYEIHTGISNPIKSHQVLTAVFNNGSD